MNLFEVVVILAFLPFYRLVDSSTQPYYQSFTSAKEEMEAEVYNKYKTFQYPCAKVFCGNSTANCAKLQNFEDEEEDESLRRNRRRRRRVNDDDSENKALYLSDICDSDEHCQMNSELTGTCETTSLYFEPEALYPGQKCSEDQYWKICAFGAQKCDDGTCKGLGDNEKCINISDCSAGQYCNSESYCVEAKEAGSECELDSECGRTGKCYYSDIKQDRGACVTYFSVVDGGSVGTEFHFEEIVGGGTKYLLSGNELLCESAYATDDGTCSSNPPTSTNKGELCMSNEDCPSSDSSITATCQCGFNSIGASFCDLLPGDDEWVDARTAFKNYYEETKKCNGGAKWEKCDAYSYYYKMRCKQLKAENYVLLLNNTDLDCLTVLQNDIPIFDEITLMCTRASANFLKVGLIISLGTIALSLLF